MRKLLGGAYGKFGWVTHYIPIPLRLAEWWQDCYYEFADKRDSSQ